MEVGAGAGAGAGRWLASSCSQQEGQAEDMAGCRGSTRSCVASASARVSANGLSLPSSTSITQAELDFVADTVVRLVAAHRLAASSAA